MSKRRNWDSARMRDYIRDYNSRGEIEDLYDDDSDLEEETEGERAKRNQKGIPRKIRDRVERT